MFKRIILHIIGSMLALLTTDYLLESFNINAVNNLEYARILLITVVIIGILNTVIKPILKIVSFPIMVVTLGLFSLVINGVILWLVTLVLPEVQVVWWQGYIFVPIVLTIFNYIVQKILGGKKG